MSLPISKEVVDFKHPGRFNWSKFEVSLDSPVRGCRKGFRVGGKTDGFGRLQFVIPIGHQ